MVRRLTLDQEIEGSNPSSPASPHSLRTSPEREAGTKARSKVDLDAGYEAEEDRLALSLVAGRQGVTELNWPAGVFGSSSTSAAVAATTG